MEKTLEKTKFSGCLITTVSANPGGSADYVEKPEGVENLIEVYFLLTTVILVPILIACELFREIHLTFKGEMLKKILFI